MTSSLPFPEADASVRFIDRRDAGEQLAQAVIDEVRHHPELESLPFVVYALPKGGLPIAAPIAQRLGCPLDVIVAKKITRPDNPELAIGAVTAEGHVVWDTQRHKLPTTAFQRMASDATPRALERDRQSVEPYDVALQQAHAHAQTQLADLVPDRPGISARGAVAILVDDGVATGMTLAAALQAVRSQQPAQVWICAPVAPLELMPFLRSRAERVIVLATPHPFYSVSRFYKEFPQVTMAEAIAYLEQTRMP